MPPATQRADDVPHLVSRARVEAGRRLVEKHQLGRDHDARRDVQPAPHPARVVLGEPAGSVRDAECLEQLGRARLGGSPLQPEQAPDQDEVLAPRQVFVHRGELARQADEASHGVGLAHDVVPEHARGAGVGAEERREHPHRRRLAGAVRAQDSIDRAAADGQVDAVDRASLAEGLDQARGLDRQWDLLVHPAPLLVLQIRQGETSKLIGCGHSPVGQIPAK